MSEIRGVLVGADTLSPAELIATAQRIEALGYAELWLPDALGREIYTTAAFVLANTESLVVASGIAHVYGRDGVASAQAARTLTELFAGRFVHGVGIANPMIAELRGAQWEHPIDKMSSHLAAMEATWFGPADRHTPTPTYVGANGPKMLQLASRQADGANTFLMPIEHTTAAREALGPDFMLNVVLPCCLATQEAGRLAARREFEHELSVESYRAAWARLGYSEQDADANDSLIDSLVAIGPLPEILSGIDRRLAAGATRIVVMPVPVTAGDPPWELLEGLSPLA